MCQCDKSSGVELALLDELIKNSPDGELLPILQEAQSVYGYLPTEVIYRIAELTGKSPANVMGVATYYTYFRREPVGKYLILLCKGTACYVTGAEMIEKAICEHLHIQDGGTSADGLFTLKCVACLGCCCLAPAMMINDKTYAHLTPGYAVSIISELRAKENEA